ncbi:MAG: LruC domain-containing protein [Bacteroidetes bacterium]|nr:LruC domain-containing protein [Bacteroidota bacterium]
MSLSIEFDQPYTSAEIGTPPFNPFLIIDGDRDKEIHLPDHSPTDLAGTDLFGTQHDNSIPANGRYYKTEANLPWAIDIWFDFAYPNEKTQVTSAHLKFADWAQSDGVNYMDWYEDEPGYRDDSKIYQIP